LQALDDIKSKNKDTNTMVELGCEAAHYSALFNEKLGWFFSPKLGAEMRSYPQIAPNDLINLRGGLSSRDIFVLGGVIGFDVRKQLGERFSLSLKSSYFFPFDILGSGTGSKFVGNESYRNFNIGVQAVYWLNKRMGLGAGGFIDQRSIGYLSPSGGEEQVSMDGTYFFGSFIYRFWTRK
jgi:hypothetical protein